MARERKVVLITGASSGIGRATATAFVNAGYRVFGTSRRTDQGSGIAGVDLLSIDVTRTESVAGGVATVLADAGRLDVLVNNAGIGIAGGAEESSIEQAQSLFDTNLFGTMRMIQAVIPAMRKQSAGRIINVSSVLGFLPAPFMALYAASKHAMHGYSQSLDHELRTWGIRVLLVEPAYTATRFDKNRIEVDQPLAVYDRPRTSMANLLQDAMATADKPELVAATILDVASARQPRLRNPSGPLAHRLTLLNRFAPAAMLDRGLRKQARLT